MKRVLLALAALLLVTSGVGVFRTLECGGWQERYQRFLYSEIVKISPVIQTPESIEQLIGERPAGCDRPSATLSNEDLERYRREGVGPNEFVGE